MFHTKGIFKQSKHPNIFQRKILVIIGFREKMKYFLFVIKIGIEQFICIWYSYRVPVCKILVFEYKVPSFFRIRQEYPQNMFSSYFPGWQWRFGLWRPTFSIGASVFGSGVCRPGSTLLQTEAALTNPQCQWTTNWYFQWEWKIWGERKPAIRWVM